MDNPREFDELPCGVIQTDAEWNIQYINTHASNLVSCESASDLIGKNVAVLFSKASCELLDSDVFPRLLAEGKAEEMQLTLKKTTAEALPIVANIKMKSDQCSYWTFVSSFERGGLQAELQSTRQTLHTQTETIARLNSANLDRQLDLKSFCHTLSHDLNGPLRRNQQLIEAAVDDLHEAHLEAPMVFEMLEAARRGSGTLIDLSRGLVEYLRADEVDLNHEHVDMNEVITTVMEMREEENSVSPAIEQDELPMIKGNKNHLQTLFRNLLDNAIKYTSKPPEITISSTEDTTDDCMIITVADNGIGIEESDIDSIFNPFIRLHNASEYSGSGLGLSVARKIARNHGGDIQVQSSPGQGSTFRVSLPLVSKFQT